MPLPNSFSLILLLCLYFFSLYRWEGFVHVALSCWSQNQNPRHVSECSSSIFYDISVNLLHATIGLIADSDHTFRKACLAGAIPLPSYSNNRLDLMQKTIFSQLLSKINIEPRFLEVLRSVEVATQKNEDAFQRIKWLQILNHEMETVERHDWNIHSMGPENLSSLLCQDKDKVEAAFSDVKSRFCSEVKFDDVIESYKMVLERYKRVRNQYMNGMISLHYGS